MNAITTHSPTSMKRWYMMNTGKTLYLLLWLLLITLLLPVVAQASVNAQLDRSTINEGETFTLNLTVSGSNSSQPDLTGLRKDAISALLDDHPVTAPYRHLADSIHSRWQRQQ